MNAIILLSPEKFPEPAFSNLQGAVFSSLEKESPALAEVIAHENQSVCGAEPPAFSPAMVRYGAYLDGELIAWSCGWLERGNSFYMAHSGVAPAHQRQGVYSALLFAVLNHARDLGAHVVRSQHSVLNNKIIACKLQRGFYIAGLSFSAQMGNLVELVHHLSEPRFQLFRDRVIPLRPV